MNNTISNTSTFDNLVQAFGRQEIRETLRYKLLEELYIKNALNAQFDAETECIKENFSGTELELRLRLLDLTTGKMVSESENRLQKYSVQYLKVTGKLTKNKDGLDEAQIQNARQYPIEKLLQTPFRKVGSRITSCCPFHQEKTASFVIYPDNSYHCFACGKHGNNCIDFYMQLNDTDFIEAVRSLI